ncbi:MAG: hypothetical protein IT317_22845 [Anaerolineales bacterium]|nr:hypothetical protein [Anaerolineales bacterium]
MRRSHRIFSLLSLASLVLAACAAPTQRPASPTPALAPTGTPSPVPPPVDLSGLHTYLTGKTGELHTATTALKNAAQTYFQLASQSNFNYAALWQNHSQEAIAAVNAARAAWTQAGPLYRQSEGIVAGTPSLADFDILLSAGASAAADAQNAAPYDLTLGDGRVLPRPGNLLGVTESTLWGTWPDFTAPVPADFNRDGTLEFGEALPDAYVLQAATAALDQYAGELQTAAAAWTPTPSDALSALVTMVPTMNEDFQSWKQSRFVAGDATTRRDLGVISRLADILDILSSLQVVHDNVSPLIQRVTPRQDQDIRQGLTDLRAFVADVYQQEQDGKVFTPEEADLLGSEAQNRATAITGLVTQAAAQLNVELVHPRPR